MSPWNPGNYLKFEAERTRPARDLCARIPLAAPGRVLDLGCGPGNSTRVLRERWPQAEIVGVDSSPEMIAQARQSCPNAAWVLADAAQYQPKAPCDVVFSNAVLQWLPDHERLIPRLLDLVAPGGCLAVQMPAKGGTLFRSSLQSVARRPGWREAMAGVDQIMKFLETEFYYDLLAPLAGRVDLWETIYYHVLANHQGLVEWYEGTGMRPYLDRLPDPEARTAFKADVLAACRGDYPVAKDGKLLMPFQRLFFVAWKGVPPGC